LGIFAGMSFDGRIHRDKVYDPPDGASAIYRTQTRA
jgi:hypothetical protein